MKIKCPHCGEEIDYSAIASQLAERATAVTRGRKRTLESIEKGKETLKAKGDDWLHERAKKAAETRWKKKQKEQEKEEEAK